ncbi:MAG TPA: GH116 family glycosyl-hydrolase, partial [Candidatus Hydrogenedens sp.]|nr:GH116 family glycosyl-hydrolase [Candidatus Hydrogenedens sp.]
MSKYMGRFVSFVFLISILLLNDKNLYSESYKLDNEEWYLINKVYSDEYLKEIAFPLGGFGAGQVYIRGDGKLSPWEIVNNFNSNANVSDAFFSIFVDDGEQSKARILQINPQLPGEGI